MTSANVRDMARDRRNKLSDLQCFLSLAAEASAPGNTTKQMPRTGEISVGSQIHL